MSEIKPKKTRYYDENELYNEYCEAVDCNSCEGMDYNGEPNGYGCDDQQQFVDDNADLILDADEYMAAADAECESLRTRLAEKDAEIEAMKCCANCFKPEVADCFARPLNEMPYGCEEWEDWPKDSTRKRNAPKPKER